MTNPPDTPLLDTVEYPSDLRKLEASELRQLSDELRAEMIDAVSVTGGHLGAGLGGGGAAFPEEKEKVRKSCKFISCSEPYVTCKLCLCSNWSIRP